MDKTSLQLTAVVLIVLSFVLLAAAPADALSVEELSDRFEVKFRRVGTIFLRARGYPVTNPSDTVQLVLAYRYPDAFLQVLRGRGSREQVVLLRGDTLAVSFPHLNLTERRVLEPRRRAKVLARNFPIAGLAGLVRLDSLPGDSVVIHDNGGTISVRVPRPARGGRAAGTIRGVLSSDRLRPLVLETEGSDGYKLEVEYYREDERLPPVVDEAFGSFDPGLVSGVKL